MPFNFYLLLTPYIYYTSLHLFSFLMVSHDTLTQLFTQTFLNVFIIRAYSYNALVIHSSSDKNPRLPSVLGSKINIVMSILTCILI